MSDILAQLERLRSSWLELTSPDELRELRNDTAFIKEMLYVLSIGGDETCTKQERYAALLLAGDYYAGAEEYGKAILRMKEALPLATSPYELALCHYDLFAYHLALDGEVTDACINWYEGFVKAAFQGITEGDADAIELVLDGGAEHMEDHALLAAAAYARSIHSDYKTPAERAEAVKRYERHLKLFQEATDAALFWSSWGRLRRKYLQEITGIEPKCGE